MREDSIVHECVLLPLVSVVHTYHKRSVVSLHCEHVKAHQVIQIKLARIERDSLIHAFGNLSLNDKVFFGRGEQRDRHIVVIFGFSHTRIYS